MLRAFVSFLSIPSSVLRKPQEQKSSRREIPNWVHAFAGMALVVLASCSDSVNESLVSYEAEEITRPVSQDALILLTSDFEGKSLIKGMNMEQATKHLEFLGWKKWDGIRVSASGMTNLWIREPCRAAAVEYSQTYKMVSNERPPKHLQLNAKFYECIEDEPVNLGQLAEVNIKEDLYAKNK